MNWYGGSGAGTQAHLLAQYLSAEKDVELMLLNSLLIDSEQKLVETKTSYGCPLFYTNNIVSGVLELEPDVLFVHSFAPYIIDAVVKLRNRGFKGKIVYRNGTNPLEQYLVYPYSTTPRHIILPTVMWQEFDAIICPSMYTTRIVSFLLPEKVSPKLVYIPPAVEVSAFVPSRNFDWLIVGSGRLEVVNPFWIPLNAYRRLSTEFPELKMKLIGGGTFQPVYRQMIETYNLHKAEVLDWMPQRDVFRWLELADVFVFPTITQNGPPLSVLEAMAAGCAVVTSWTAAINELESVIKVPLEDVTAWYQEMRKLIADEEYREEVVRRQLKEVEFYDVENVIPVYVQVFKDLAGES